MTQTDKRATAAKSRRTKTPPPASKSSKRALLAEMQEFFRQVKLPDGGAKGYRRLYRGKIAGLPKCPAHFPKAPHHTFAEIGWVGYGPTLGLYEKKALLAEMRRFFRLLVKLPEGEHEAYVAYRQGKLKNLLPCPPHFPEDPPKFFAEAGWISYGRSLGLVDRRALLAQMKAFFAKVKLPYTGAAGYEDYLQGLFPNLPPPPHEFPSQPQKYFEGAGWVGYGASLGLQELKKKAKPEEIWPFKKARDFVRALKLRSTDEWRLYRIGKLKGQKPRPWGLPSNPGATYKDSGWQGYPDFLGYAAPWARGPGEKMPFEEARKFVHQLKLPSFKAYKKYCAGLRKKGQPPRPSTLPKWPAFSYKAQWAGPADFLGQKKAGDKSTE